MNLLFETYVIVQRGACKVLRKPLVFIFLDQALKTGKGIMGECLFLLTTDFYPTTLYMIKVAAVLIFMTIDTQIFPVAAVEWVIIMVVVLVVHSQKVQIFVGELSTTTGTYPGMDFQGLLPVGLFMLVASIIYTKCRLRAFLSQRLLLDTSRI
jgi:hypothetical protein